MKDTNFKIALVGSIAITDGDFLKAVFYAIWFLIVLWGIDKINTHYYNKAKNSSLDK